MMRAILTHAAAAYLGAGLSLGLVMAQVMPLTPIGVGFYTVTWPRQVYCAQVEVQSCFGSPEDVLFWLLSLLFDAERITPEQGQ